MRAGRNLGHRQPPSGGVAPPDRFLTNPSVGADCAYAVPTPFFAVTTTTNRVPAGRLAGGVYDRPLAPL